MDDRGSIVAGSQNSKVMEEEAARRGCGNQQSKQTSLVSGLFKTFPQIGRANM
jgi:hypothetical protein